MRRVNDRPHLSGFVTRPLALPLCALFVQEMMKGNPCLPLSVVDDVRKYAWIARKLQNARYKAGAQETKRFPGLRNIGSFLKGGPIVDFRLPEKCAH